MKKDTIYKEVLAPLASRVGTLGAGAILAMFPSGTSAAEELAAALTVIILVGIDLLSSAWRRRAAEQKGL